MTCRRRLARVAVPAAVLLAWVAQAQQEPLTAKPFTQPEFVEAECPMWPGRARGVHVDCGYLSVPEDRAKPDGNVIRLAVARLRGSVPSPHPDPVIYLAGGPGESTLERTHRFIHDARFIWEERDLILLDQRGIGHSEPRLECPDYRRQNAELRELDLDPDEALQRKVDALLACKRTLSEQGIDVSAYSPQAVAADVVDVAEAMGYEAFNLFGNSFGTMLALTVMRDFPDNVRAAILDGVWPPQVNATEARHANAASALEAFFRHCETDPECAQRYPDLEQELWQVVDRYTEHLTLTFSNYDPYVSESFEEEVDGHFILRRVLESLRSHSWIPYVPFLLHRIAGGDHDVADAFIGPTQRSLVTSIDNSAAWASLLCHADGRFADLSGILADQDAYPRIGDPEAPDLVPALCAAWHDPTVAPADRTPVASDIPTLLLSGQLDPTTPPRWADLAAETLTRSHSFVVPMAGHGVGMDTPCGRKLAGAFLHAPGADPSPACSPRDRKRSGFRTIFLHHPMSKWGFNMWHSDSAGTADTTRTTIVPRTTLVLGVLFILVLHLSALIVWPTGAVIRRVASGADVPAPRLGYPRVTAAAIIALSAGFWWSMRAAEEFLLLLLTHRLPHWMSRLLFSALNAPDELGWLADEVARNFGYYSWVLPLFYIPYLTAAATVYVLYLAYRSWRKKWWTRLGRVHYSIVAITLVWYPFHLFASGYIL